MRRVQMLLLVVLAAACSRQPGSGRVIEIETRGFGAADMLWDLKNLSSPPEFAWIDSTSTVRSLMYESVPYGGKPTQVFAYYSNPDLLRGQNTGRSFPAVVLVHGGGGTAFRQWVEKWAADGYAAIAMDLNGKTADRQPVPHPGPVMNGPFRFSNIDSTELKEMWTYHAVARVVLAHSFLLSRPEVDENKTCLTGISWGGYLTCITGSLDNRFKAVAPVYGCGFYDESDAFGKEFRSMTPEGRDRWMKYFDPSSYLSYATQPMLFVNGNVDYFYNVVPYSKSYELVRADKNISFRPDMRHGHVEGWQPVEIKYFFESKIGDGAPLPTVAPIAVGDSVATSRYVSLIGLRAASFHYSLDTASTNEKRTWFRIDARIDPDQKTVTCKLPRENLKYAFFYVTDHREVSVSSPILLNPQSANR